MGVSPKNGKVLCIHVESSSLFFKHSPGGGGTGWGCRKISEKSPPIEYLKMCNFPHIPCFPKPFNYLRQLKLNRVQIIVVKSNQTTSGSIYYSISHTRLPDMHRTTSCPIKWCWANKHMPSTNKLTCLSWDWFLRFSVPIGVCRSQSVTAVGFRVRTFPDFWV